jgi:hypothetical protein
VTVLGVATAKGSPGATTTVLALASAWPQGRPVTVIDLDLAGGDVAGWLELPGTPNVSTLAADCRHGIDPDGLAANARRLPGQGEVQVVAGARSPEEAAAAVELLHRAGFDALLEGLALRGDVLVDFGRLDALDPRAPMLPHLDALLVVARPTWSQVHHIGTRLAAWRAHANVRMVLVGDRPYGPADVAEALGVDVVGVLADDPSGAGVFSGSHVRTRGLGRTRLWRSAAALSDRLTRDQIEVGPSYVNRAGAVS